MNTSTLLLWQFLTFCLWLTIISWRAILCQVSPREQQDELKSLQCFWGEISYMRRVLRMVNCGYRRRCCRTLRFVVWSNTGGRNVDCLTAQFVGCEGRSVGVSAVEHSVHVAREADEERDGTLRAEQREGEWCSRYRTRVWREWWNRMMNCEIHRDRGRGGWRERQKRKHNEN